MEKCKLREDEKRDVFFFMSPGLGEKTFRLPNRNRISNFPVSSVL